MIDRRHFLDLDSIQTQATTEEKRRFPSFVEELMGRLAATEKRFEEKKAQIDEEITRTKARLDADFQRRIEIERQKILLPFLEVLDSLEQALAAAPREGDSESFRLGVEMISCLFRSKLQADGIEAIPVLNQPFDPNLGQAVAVIPVVDPDRDGVVVDEVRRGYRMGDQLLRPAQVGVGQLKVD